MSLFEHFKLAKNIATMICEKNKNDNNYNCKLDFDYESALLNSSYKYNEKVTSNDLFKFIKEDLLAKEIKIMGKKAFVVMNNRQKLETLSLDHTSDFYKNHDIDIHYFGNDDENEIHIIKHPLSGSVF